KGVPGLVDLDSVVFQETEDHLSSSGERRVDSTQQRSAWTRSFWILSSSSKRENSFFIRRVSSGIETSEEFLDLLIRIRSVSSKETKISSPEERSVEAACFGTL
ncbi:hypothetical protein AVEN_267027-1, partial [Araneus ventricosus]